MDILIILAVVVAGIGLALFVVLLLRKKQLNAAFENAQRESAKILEEARKEADMLIKAAMSEARDEGQKKRNSLDDEIRNRRNDITKLENKIKSREQSIEKKLEIIEKREVEIEGQKKKLDDEELKYKKLIIDYEKSIDHAKKTLENVANMSAEEAKKELIASIEKEARKEAQDKLRQIEEETKKEAEARARSVVSLAVQRISSEYVNDSTITVVALPSEDMKGRIIGREGRNIRAIEQSTGVDLIIDDTPEAVIVSCFNPIRREVAKVTIERLIADGRIHPARIDETAKRVIEEFDQIMRDHGEQAMFETGITDVHPELVKSLGKLRYRTSGMQTILQHSVEVAHICGIMAGEMGLNVKKAKRCGLLHDIGKAVDQEVEGHHALIGAELCQKYGESQEIIAAVKLHHEEDLASANPYVVVLHAANILSENRPGARKELLESYIQRLEDMESLVKGFDKIDQAYVIQAGREVRALVTPNATNDEDIIDLSNDIASKLRQELSFPGQVKVTVVRESRVSDFAK